MYLTYFGWVKILCIVVHAIIVAIQNPLPVNFGTFTAYLVVYIQVLFSF